MIALTGQTGGKRLRDLADLTIRVPSPSIEQVEDAHLMIAHSLCVTLRGHLASRAPRRATSAAALPRLGRRRRPITIVERAEPPLLAGEIEPPVEAVGG